MKITVVICVDFNIHLTFFQPFYCSVGYVVSFCIYTIIYELET